MDRNIAQYKVKIRNNNWWWQIFTYLLSASLSNARLLHRWQISNHVKLLRSEGGSSEDAQIEEVDMLGFI